MIAAGSGSTLARRLSFIALLAGVGAGCGGQKHEADAPLGLSTVPPRPVAAFSFESLDARPVSSAAFAGKPLVVAFITTWDMLSQAQVRFMVEMDKHDQGKVGYAAVCLQEAKDRELIEVYKNTLGITFPMAIAERATLANGGPFADVQTVPTVVLLDGSGNVRVQKVGLVKPEEIRGALRGM